MNKSYKAFLDSRNKSSSNERKKIINYAYVSVFTQARFFDNGNVETSYMKISCEKRIATFQENIRMHIVCALAVFERRLVVNLMIIANIISLKPK